MIVSFSGSLGSGKSGIAQRLASKLGWPYYDIGKIRRKLASDRGMTLEEYNKFGETDASTDLEVDHYQASLGKNEDNFIIVGRTSWYCIPHSKKFFIKARLEVGAARIFKDLAGRNEANDLKTVEDVKLSLERRMASDALRYKKYFNIDVYNEANYDYVVDTSDITEEEAFAKVCDILEI